MEGAEQIDGRVVVAHHPERRIGVGQGLDRRLGGCGDPMQLEVDDSRPTVTCAWHGWEFDVRDGRAIAPGNGLRVRSYPACVRDGVVLVDLGATVGR